MVNFDRNSFFWNSRELVGVQGFNYEIWHLRNVKSKIERYECKRLKHYERKREWERNQERNREKERVRERERETDRQTDRQRQQ